MHFYKVKNDCADLPASASDQLLLNYFSGDEVFEPNFPDFLFVRAFYYCSKRFFVEHTGKPPPTIFFPVASINVGISSKNLLTFVTLLPHLF